MTELTQKEVHALMLSANTTKEWVERYFDVKQRNDNKPCEWWGLGHHSLRHLADKEFEVVSQRFLPHETLCLDGSTTPLRFLFPTEYCVEALLLVVAKSVVSVKQDYFYQSSRMVEILERISPGERNVIEGIGCYQFETVLHFTTSLFSVKNNATFDDILKLADLGVFWDCHAEAFCMRVG